MPAHINKGSFHAMSNTGHFKFIRESGTTGGHIEPTMPQVGGIFPASIESIPVSLGEVNHIVHAQGRGGRSYTSGCQPCMQSLTLYKIK